jgi:hypothetical protein
MSSQLLDGAPIVVILLLFALLMLAAYEVGFRVGRWWQDRTPGEQEGPTGVLVGSLLALMAFLLGITMGMAADRFDTRRGLVLEEANAIRAAYLQAGYLRSPESEQARELLREYATLRVATNDQAALQANIARSEEIQAELWSIAETLVRETDPSDLLALFVDSVTGVIQVHHQRITAGLYARVPETVLLLLLAGSVLTLGMVGYSAGITGRRSLMSAAVLVVALSVVTILVIDLDRPRDGFIVVSQQPLIELQADIGAPAP